MAIRLITWFFFIISCYVQWVQGQHHNLIQLQSSINEDYNLSSAALGAVLEEQEFGARVSNQSTMSSVGLSTSTHSLLPISTKRDDSGDSTTTAVAQLSSTGDKLGASTSTLLNKDEVEIGTASLPHSAFSNTTASSTDVSEETTTGNLHGSSSVSFRSVSEDVTASRSSASTAIQLTTDEAGNGSASLPTTASSRDVSQETTMGNLNGSSSSASLWNDSEDVVTASKTTSSLKNVTAEILCDVECNTSSSTSEGATTLTAKVVSHMSATPGVNSTGALDSLGKVGFIEPWRIWKRATGVLAVTAILLLAFVIPMIFLKTRRYMLRRDTFTGIPDDVELSAMASSESSRESTFSAEQAAVITRPSSEVIVL